ncbi:MAG: pyridoxamine 5'-phosphate oxidase family protein [Oscillospiraceae bacterium]|nr:pyridoxamine 5'-phosphate oxidase family protein [Oscillospiraceae bacterium]MDD4368223.1 pyridoxamine 5'-phosphate oxidase family protein [Oscillospiraceae bacterium]
MRRSKQQISAAECEQILCSAARGVLAVADEDGYPYAFPMNYLYRDEKIYFHSARSGHKLAALAKDPQVSFCVMNQGYKKAGEWALNIASVIVFGQMRLLEAGPEAESRLRQIGLKYYPDAVQTEAAVRQGAEHVQILVLEPDFISGKLVKES